MQKEITQTIKRSYHPLVIYYYYSNLLSNEQLALIPNTTIAYWDKNKLHLMFGFDWVKEFSLDYEDFTKTQKHKIIFKSARLCCKLFDTLSVICSNMKGYKRVFKSNTASIIHTIDYLSKEIKLDKACRIFKISTNQYYRWKNKIYCSASVLNLCFKTHPHQLTIAEASIIKDAVNSPENMFKKLATIWYKLMRDEKLYCSRSTFYKYTSLLSEQIKKHVYVRPKQIIHATRIFEYIHIDTTFLPTIKNGSVRAVMIKDNYSKKILHSAIVENGDSKWIAKLLRELFSKYGLQNYKQQMTIVSDGGSENKGEVIDWINDFDKNMVIKKTAKTEEFAFTNNEIESTFNIFKNEFLANTEIIDKEYARKSLIKFQLYNDNERYPIALYGLTPQEVFDGHSINKNRFKDRIQETAKLRNLKNKSGRFCDVCS